MSLFLKPSLFPRFTMVPPHSKISTKSINFQERTTHLYVSKNCKDLTKKLEENGFKVSQSIYAFPRDMVVNTPKGLKLTHLKLMDLVKIHGAIYHHIKNVPQRVISLPGKSIDPYIFPNSNNIMPTLNPTPNLFIEGGDIIDLGSMTLIGNHTLLANKKLCPELSTETIKKNIASFLEIPSSQIYFIENPSYHLDVNIMGLPKNTILLHKNDYDDPFEEKCKKECEAIGLKVISIDGKGLLNNINVVNANGERHIFFQQFENTYSNKLRYEAFLNELEYHFNFTPHLVSDFFPEGSGPRCCSVNLSK